MPGMNEWRAFMAKYMPGADQTDGGYIAAYGLCKTMLQVLQQCERRLLAREHHEAGGQPA